MLDTTVLVASERGDGVLDDVIDDADDVAIAAATAAELLVGVELADARRRPRRIAFVEEVLASILVEGYDLDVARAHAVLLASALRQGRTRGAHDLIIAATAVAQDRIVVTTDVTGFAGLPAVDVRAI